MVTSFFFFFFAFVKIIYNTANDFKILILKLLVFPYLKGRETVMEADFFPPPVRSPKPVKPGIKLGQS